MPKNDRRSPSPRRPIPAHWEELMQRRGIPSVRQLANRAGLSQPAVNRVVYGDGDRATDETLAKIAEALGIPMADVYWLAGQEAPYAKRWTPPAEANRLTPKQRTALEGLILSMVDPGERVQLEADETSNVRQLYALNAEHPEDEGADFAADQGHGLSQGQIEWEDGEEPQA